jgi:uncharacterized membrane-anchored protein YhcB (DUF1043 family)
MAWGYGLIGMIIGIIIGAVAMRFGNRQLRQQQTLQSELEQSKSVLEKYRHELAGYCAHNAELFDNMARDYRELYQQMVKDPSDMLPTLPLSHHPFYDCLTKSEADNDSSAMKVPPRDYPGAVSNLSHKK